MKVIVKKEKCKLSNDDIKWYLCDECLWITKYNEYEDVEKSIGRTMGSFNWLYNINDTVLFQKGSGKFETAIIDLKSIVSPGSAENFFPIDEKRGIQGNLYLQDMRIQDYEFSEQVYYDKHVDFLYSIPRNLKRDKTVVLFLVDDFAFVIEENELKGWILKNASSHVHIDGMERKLCPDGASLLDWYIKELNLWDENDDTARLKKLLEVVKGREDTVSMSIEECIESILSWEH